MLNSKRLQRALRLHYGAEDSSYIEETTTQIRRDKDKSNIWIHGMYFLAENGELTWPYCHTGLDR
jgi:hypothetical protein